MFSFFKNKKPESEPLYIYEITMKDGSKKRITAQFHQQALEEGFRQFCVKSGNPFAPTIIFLVSVDDYKSIEIVGVRPQITKEEM